LRSQVRLLLLTCSSHLTLYPAGTRLTSWSSTAPSRALSARHMELPSSSPSPLRLPPPSPRASAPPPRSAFSGMPWFYQVFLILSHSRFPSNHDSSGTCSVASNYASACTAAQCAAGTCPGAPLCCPATTASLVAKGVPSTVAGGAVPTYTRAMAQVRTVPSLSKLHHLTQISLTRASTTTSWSGRPPGSPG
jgi:hypothetical protein